MAQRQSGMLFISGVLVGVISNAWIARVAGDNVLVYSWVSAMFNIFFLVYIAVGLRIFRVPA